MATTLANHIKKSVPVNAPPREYEMLIKSIPKNTLNVYQTAFNTYKRVMGVELDFENPTQITPKNIVDFIVNVNNKNGKPPAYSTLMVHLSGLRTYCKITGQEDATIAPEVDTAKKQYGKWQGKRQKRKNLLTENEIFKIIKFFKDQKTVLAERNALILLIAWYGAARRGEIANLKIENIKSYENGIVIFLERCKTDQTGEKNYCLYLPFSNNEYCPAKLLDKWLAHLKSFGITSGYLFRRMARSGYINLKNNPLSGVTINNVFKEGLKSVGLDEKKYSIHCIRGSAAKTAYINTRDFLQIQRTGRWERPETITKYYIDFENDEFLKDHPLLPKGAKPKQANIRQKRSKQPKSLLRPATTSSGNNSL
jgi:integrase